MVPAAIARLQPCPRLYLVAGAVLVGYAALNGAEAFTTATFQKKVLEGGYVAGFLGLLGLYPSLDDRSPWLARIGAAAAVLGLVAFSVFTIGNVAELVGLVSGDLPRWSVFTLMAAVGFVGGYLTVGVAVLHSGTYSRTVGVLLLVPAVIIVLMIASIVTGLASPESVFVVITNSSVTDGVDAETIIGVSEYLDAMELHPNVPVVLESRVHRTQNLTAVVINDTNSNDRYDYPDDDEPYTIDGEFVSDSATVHVATPTPTPTATPTPTPTPSPSPTATASPTPSPSPSPTGTPASTSPSPTADDSTATNGPGFGPVIAIVALVLLTVLLHRRGA